MSARQRNDNSAAAAILRQEWRPQFWLQHPGYACIQNAAERICTWSQWPDAAAYYLQLSMQAPVQFVGVEVSAYEDHIAETGQVPTRYSNWHDLLNALIWHRYPRSKTALNRLHQLAKQQRILDSQRGRRRDAATLFDESGAIVCSADPELLQLIRQMDWPALFLQHRACFGGRLQVHLFGHGLLDQLRNPFLGLTAHALLLELPPDVANDPQALDAAVASAITERMAQWTPAELAPLPILGIPGWWPGNEAPAFYQNEQYFRRQRRRQDPPASASQR